MGLCSAERNPDHKRPETEAYVCSKSCRKLFVNVCVEGVEFDLVGASFTQKTNLFKQARAPKAMAWKRPGQGFDFGFTGKGSQKDTGGTVAQFMTVIAYGKGESGA